MRRFFLILILSALCSCSHWNELSRKHQGAAIGAGSGAVIGSIVGGPVGTVVGGVSGALAGGVVASETRR